MQGCFLGLGQLGQAHFTEERGHPGGEAASWQLGVALHLSGTEPGEEDGKFLHFP